MFSDYRDNNYANIEDIEYMFIDLDTANQYYYKDFLMMVIKDIIVEVM